MFDWGNSFGHTEAKVVVAFIKQEESRSITLYINQLSNGYTIVLALAHLRSEEAESSYKLR